MLENSMAGSEDQQALSQSFSPQNYILCIMAVYSQGVYWLYNQSSIKAIMRGCNFVFRDSLIGIIDP